MKKYYVYRITNKLLNKHYYGYRSIEESIIPLDDLGVNYFSSSSDALFILDQKVNPDLYKYKIIFTTTNKNGAISLEIKLHKKFKVNINSNFYNKAIQTSVGCSIVTKGKFKVYIDGILQLVSKSDYDSSYMIPANKNKVVALDTVTGNKLLIDKSTFDSNDRYVGHSTNYVTAFDPVAHKNVKLTKTEYHSGNYIHANEGFKHTTELKSKLSKQRKFLITAKNYDGDIKRLHINDPLIVNGEYSQLNSGKFSITKDGIHIKNTIAIRIELQKLGFSDNDCTKIINKIRYNYHHNNNNVTEIYGLIIKRLQK